MDHCKIMMYLEGVNSFGQIGIKISNIFLKNIIHENMDSPLATAIAKLALKEYNKRCV